MARRFYNEHLYYPDPILAASKSTRHRELKRRRLSSVNAEDLSRPEQAATKPASSNDTENQDKFVTLSDNEATEDHEEQFSDLEEQFSDHEELFSDHEEQVSDEYSDHELQDAVVDKAIEEPSRAEELGPPSSCDAMIFQNCPLTVTSSLLLIKKYQMRHKLTQEALSDLLQLMRLHFPTPNLLPSSLYLFNKQLPLLGQPLEYTYFCSRCLQELSSKDESVCSNSSCGYSLSGARAISSFIEVPLEPQLLTLLQSTLMCICLFHI